MSEALAAENRKTVVGALAALAIIAALGALNLSYPFVPDQTVAFYAAKSIAAGGTLYIDFWDNKIPGLV